MAESRLAQFWVVAALLVLISLSVLVAAHFVVNSSVWSSNDGPVRQATMTDAHMQCSKKLRAELGSRLGSFGEDQLSSRYSQKEARYLMFFDVQVKSPDGGYLSAYATCKVNDKGRIKDFHVSFGGKEGNSHLPQIGGHPFGFGE